MERSTVYCTNCGGQFVQELQLDLNGNHEITCPLCQHVHYRVVRDGVVTEDRYRSSAGPLIPAISFTMTGATTTISSTYITSGNSTFLTGSWLNSTTISS